MQNKKKYVGLSDAERSEIEILKLKGYSIRKIAEVLGRSPNTVSREIKTNSVSGEYVAKKAKAKSRVARRSRRLQWQKIEKCPELRKFVIEKLEAHWSPDEISGHLRDNPEIGQYVSSRQIYTWLYSSRGQPYCEHLYSKRYHPRKRPAKRTERVMISDRIPLSERPTAAQNRAEAGHYEYDSVVSSKRSRSTFALAVLVERTTRLVSAKLVPNLKPEPFAKSILAQIGNKPVLSFTTDNGIENKRHRIVTEKTGALVYFTDPYCSWQKGSVENANKMLRRYFPKGTDFSQVSQDLVDQAVARINQKPRKILGYKSAIQCAYEKGII
ncbi:IS30 family transposase [Candidatus Saccharibacteria bacterium]|nr:IS30 family transposase [Candidatus Saccharibacteria bacterium]